MRLFLKILPFVFSVLIAHVKEAHARFSYALQENKFELSLELEAKELQEEKEEIKSILPKLASHFSSKAAVSVIGESGATVIERFAEAGADDIAFSVMAKYEVLVTPATKGFLAQSILAQGMKQGLNYADDAAKGGGSLLSAGELARIENAATRINKPITVVGSRASGKAGAYSDWDYIIEGGLKSKEWSKIKNSLPGARSILDNTPRNIDILPGPVWPGYPHITIYPR